MGEWIPCIALLTYTLSQARDWKLERASGTLGMKASNPAGQPNPTPSINSCRRKSRPRQPPPSIRGRPFAAGRFLQIQFCVVAGPGKRQDRRHGHVRRARGSMGDMESSVCCCCYLPFRGAPFDNLGNKSSYSVLANFSFFRKKKCLTRRSSGETGLQ